VTVRELIAELAKMEPDLPVYYYGEPQFGISEVEEVRNQEVEYAHPRRCVMLI
jgi:hypothetical protein